VGSRVRITVVHPRTNKLRGTRSDLNSNSVVLRIDHKKDCFLLTGDAEDPSERAMMKNEIAECDVLKVAHHGSKHSTSMEWLNTIQPRIAVISAGQGNRYKHPSQDTLNRLERIKAQVHRTDLEGTVTLVSTGRSITVQTERVAPERALGTESELLAATSQSTREPTADTTKKKKKKRGFFQWLFGKKDN